MPSTERQRRAARAELGRRKKGVKREKKRTKKGKKRKARRPFGQATMRTVKDFATSALK